MLLCCSLSCSQNKQMEEAEHRRQDALDICCLQILRAILHNQRKIINPEQKPEDLWRYVCIQIYVRLLLQHSGDFKLFLFPLQLL